MPRTTIPPPTLARESCLRYAQSAAVHIGADGVPRLVLHPRIAIG